MAYAKQTLWRRARASNWRVTILAYSAAVIGIFAAAALYAQGPTVIKTDTSWGRTARTIAPSGSATTVTGNKGTVYNVPGNVYTIPESVGKTAGPNLFHSFDSFNVGRGDAAVFMTQTQSLTNVISRVSGNSASSIEGLITLQPAAGSKPNFYFINPNGVAFGAGAQVDVPAAFHASTAHEVRFKDGVVFRAGNGSDSTLTIAAPEAFRFLGGESQISIKDVTATAPQPFVTSYFDATASGVEVDNSSLQIAVAPISGSAAGARLVGVGTAQAELPVENRLSAMPIGAVHLSNSWLNALGTNFTSSASALYGGDVLASAIVLATDTSLARGLLMGMFGPSISVRDAALLVESFAGSEAQTLVTPGSVTLSGGTIAVDRTYITGRPGSDGVGGPIAISIQASGDLTLSRSTVQTYASGSAAGGSIEINVGSRLTAMANAFGSSVPNTFIHAQASYNHDGGKLSITAQDAAFNDIEIATSTASGTGNAGDIQIHTDAKLALSGAGIVRSTTESASAHAGAIKLDAKELIIGGQGVLNQATAGSSGQTRDIALAGTASLTVDEPGIFILNRGSAGPGASVSGAIALQTPKLTLLNDASIAGVSTGDVPPSTVTLNGHPYTPDAAMSPIQIDGSWGRTPHGVAWSDNGYLDGSFIDIPGNWHAGYTVNGKIYNITEADGKRSGTNLFFSFDRFNVPAGDAAIFTTTSLLQNVISRVSGTSASSIEGLLVLRPLLGTPQFFLINPAGVVFGGSAKLDAPAALHMSTASSIRFSDATLFTAGRGADLMASPLSVVGLHFSGRDADIVFGLSTSAHIGSPYLDITASNVRVVSSSFELDSLTDDAKTRSTMRFVGAGSSSIDIPLEGGLGLRASGSVRLESTWLRAVGPDFATGINNGVVDASVLVMSTDTGPNGRPLLGLYGPAIRLDGAQLTIDSARTANSTAGARAGIALFGDVVTINDSLLATPLDPTAGGPSADIEIHAHDLSMARSQILTSTSGAAPGGSIDIDVQSNMTMASGDASYTRALISTQTTGEGKAGNITLHAGTLAADGEISTHTRDHASGRAGDLRVDVDGRLSLNSSGAIVSATDSAGAAGQIDISGGEVDIGGRGVLNRAAFGSSAQNGSVRLTATDRLIIERPGVFIVNNASTEHPLDVEPSTISVFTPHLELASDARIATISNGNVPAAAMFVNGVAYNPTPAASPIAIDSSWGRHAHAVSWSDDAQFSGGSITMPWGGTGSAPVITGKVYTITEADGRVSGTNLFQSFSRFAIPQHDAVVFTTTTPSLQNVIARVSGSLPSSIEGLLTLEPAADSKPNLYLINPAGITFGAGALVDVPAALHISTASGLRFADQTMLTAGSGPDSKPLSAVAPEAFRFLGTEADIAVKGGDITVVAGSFDATAANVSIDSSAFTMQTPSFGRSQDGQMRLIAAGSATGTLPVAGSWEQVPKGEIKIKDSAVSYTGSDLGLTIRSFFDETSFPFAHLSGELRTGAVFIAEDLTSQAAHLLEIRGSAIDMDRTNILGTTHSKPIDVRFTASQSIELANNSTISDGEFPIQAGTIKLSAPAIRIADTRIEFDGVQSPFNGETTTPELVLDAQTITVEGSRVGGDDFGRDVNIRAKSVTLRDTDIDAGVRRQFVGTGKAGHVTIHALDQLMLDSVQISAGTTDPISNGGDIRLNAPNLSIVNSGLSASTTSDANAGDIIVTADTIKMNHSGFATSTEGSGSAGNVTISAANTIQFEEFGRVNAEALGSGNTGNISISAKRITFDGWTVSSGNQSSGEHRADIRPSTVQIIAPEIALIDTSISTETLGNVQAGKILLMPSADGVGDLSIVADARSSITSSSRQHIATSGNAGQIEIRATNINLSGATFTSEALPGSTGDGGSIALYATGEARLLNGTRMTTNTFDVGNAGTVTIEAGGLTLEASQISTITDGRPFKLFAYGVNWDIPARSVTGNAGNIRVDVKREMSVLNNSRIATDTAGSGSAGDVTIKAGTILVDPSEISSRAIAQSSGQTGNINVGASHSVTIADGSKLSIQNDAPVGPRPVNQTSITVSAPLIELHGGEISAASTEDLPASNVRVAATDQFVMRNASIKTTAQDGNGGGIQVDGGHLLLLDHSQITTSVFGTHNGNGGDIRVSAQDIVMNTGSIQANTAAARANGGSVLIDAAAVVASGTVIVGGNTPVRFDPSLSGINVIQAAAPDGVSGNVTVTAPVLDIAGSLRGLSAEVSNAAPVRKDLCRLGSGSSLTPIGRGGLRPTAAGLIRPESVAALSVSHGAMGAAASRYSPRYTQAVTAYGCDY